MKYKEERILYAIKLQELGLSSKYICKKLGVCRQTYYRWKKQYSKMGQIKLQEVSSLKKENAALRKIVADLSIAKHMLRQD